MRNTIGLCVALALIATASVGAGQKATPGKAAAAKSSYAPVDAIFKKNCVGCHQGTKPAHGLNLASYAMVMKGDKQGKVVVPKSPAGSRLSKAVHRVKGVDPMPPGQSLPKAQIAVIDAWIKAGAKK